MSKSFFDQTNVNDIVSLFLLVITSLLSSIGGVCGGMFNVPIALYILNFKMMDSMPFSCSLIFGLNLIKFLLSFTEPEFRTRKQILFDLDIAALFSPMTVIGSTFGVLLSSLLPQIITLILFALSILPFCFTLSKKAVQLYKQEEVAMCCQTNTAEIPYYKEYPIIWDRLLVIVGQCALLFIFSILKKPNYILDLQSCSAGWWVLTLIIVPIAILAQIFIMMRLGNQQSLSLQNTTNTNLIERNNQLYKDRLILKQNDTYKIVLIGLVIGLSSGLFGIGGCLFTGAYLMQRNFNPRLSSFTTGFMTMYSSFVTLLQLVIMDRVNYSYSLMGMISIVIGTFLGIKVFMKIVNYKKKLSIIVMILALILISTITIIFAEQINDIVNDVNQDQPIFDFSDSKLCN